MMHKYWGRKPHNVINEYIKAFTKKGDVILDPFMGSGVVIIESVKLNRHAIGVDLNPLACFIAKNTLTNVDLDLFSREFNNIFDKNFKKFSYLYETQCPTCNVIGSIENSIWEDEVMILIKGSCHLCGQFKKKVQAQDLALIEESKKTLKLLSNKNHFYPTDQILDYVKRSKRTHINQLFTDRALIILGFIKIDIEKVTNPEIRDLLLLCFSSLLPNVSKMIPGDKQTINGKSGWVISKLWVPAIHTEKNIFSSFKNRFKKVKSGKSETNLLISAEKKFEIYNMSSENLKNIKKGSIDYIFTDPPYGETIAYFGLSMFFNSWLKHSVEYADEIIYDPYREKKYVDYSERLNRVFKELYRVLKDGKYMSFSFHNRDLKIWKCVIDAVNDAGFELKNIVYQEQAVQSGTQGINFKNTFRGDFIYNYLKDSKSTKKRILKIKDINSAILDKVDQIYKKNNELTSDKLYEELIPYIVKNNIYADEEDNPVDIEKIISARYIYKLLNKTKKIYGWTIKK
jgi:DNA modification methylase